MNLLDFDSVTVGCPSRAPSVRCKRSSGNVWNCSTESHRLTTRQPPSIGPAIRRRLPAGGVPARFQASISAVPYDSLIVAAGATESYFGHGEFAIHGPGTKTIDDARELRGPMLARSRSASLTPSERDAWLTFAVVGAGPPGVELAGIEEPDLVTDARTRSAPTRDRPARARRMVADSV